MSELSLCGVVGAVREACVVAIPRIKNEIALTKSQLSDSILASMQDDVLALCDATQLGRYENCYKYFLFQLVALEKILGDLVKAEARMATAELQCKSNFFEVGFFN